MRVSDQVSPTAASERARFLTPLQDSSLLFSPFLKEYARRLRFCGGFLPIKRPVNFPSPLISPFLRFCIRALPFSFSFRVIHFVSRECRHVTAHPARSYDFLSRVVLNFLSLVEIATLPACNKQQKQESGILFYLFIFLIRDDCKHISFSVKISAKIFEIARYSSFHRCNLIFLEVSQCHVSHLRYRSLALNFTTYSLRLTTFLILENMREQILQSVQFTRESARARLRVQSLSQPVHRRSALPSLDVPSSLSCLSSDVIARRCAYETLMELPPHC